VAASIMIPAMVPALEDARCVRGWGVIADARIHGTFSHGRNGRFLNGCVVAFCAVWTARVKVEVGQGLLERAVGAAFLSWDQYGVALVIRILTLHICILQDQHSLLPLG
jgi:hypothetical protein